MRLRAFALLLGLLSLSATARSQVIDLDKDRVPVTELNGPWRFHTGDYAAWSMPGLRLVSCDRRQALDRAGL